MTTAGTNRGPESERVVGDTAAPRLSVVIPVHNEAEILEAEVGEIVAGLEARGLDYELLVCENGSTDATLALADSRLRQHDPPSRQPGESGRVGALVDLEPLWLPAAGLQDRGRTR